MHKIITYVTDGTIEEYVETYESEGYKLVAICQNINFYYTLVFYKEKDAG